MKGAEKSGAIRGNAFVALARTRVCVRLRQGELTRYTWSLCLADAVDRDQLRALKVHFKNTIEQLWQAPWGWGRVAGGLGGRWFGGVGGGGFGWLGWGGLGGGGVGEQLWQALLTGTE